MKKALAMLGLALTVLVSVPAVHADTVDTSASTNTVIIRSTPATDPNTVIIRDVANTSDYNTVIIRDIAETSDYTVIIRDEAVGFTPDWTVIIRELDAMYPGLTFSTEQIDPNTVIIRGEQDGTDASPSTVIIRNDQPATVIIR